MRFFLDISFKGTEYAGWQVQPNAIAVQQKINEALSIIFRQELQCVGAGRTDAGVHSRQMFAHFDMEIADNEQINSDFLSLKKASLNGVLPYDIAINRLIRPTSPTLHARFDALSRAYEYHLVFRKSPFEREQSLWVKRQLNLDAMQAAAALLLEYKDFASFCKAHGDNKTTLCKLDRAEWEVRDGKWIFHVAIFGLLPYLQRSATF